LSSPSYSDIHRARESHEIFFELTKTDSLL
jgi:hypothetical protein